MGKARTENGSVDITDWRDMARARAMADLYEANAKLTSKYVHACANGHEPSNSPQAVDSALRTTSTPTTGTTPSCSASA